MWFGGCSGARCFKDSTFVTNEKIGKNLAISFQRYDMKLKIFGDLQVAILDTRKGPSGHGRFGDSALTQMGKYRTDLLGE